ncbi:DUF1496 domain-containing protein [uncultured Photobacterium sp.]|uniref:DUF1496 domain-containing protein n=1 Tax=uncultured Photobacterium sp. TaxID=173973 RepID=UPI00261BD48B|nr:DUF1496 domain-containing protein [uncultured Photobacterium sp.]
MKFTKRAILALACSGLVMGTFSSVVLAKEVSVTSKPEITLQPMVQNQRVCFYDGKEYSVGAVLVVGEIILECGPENDFESNGKVRWNKLEKQQ